MDLENLLNQLQGESQPTAQTQAQIQAIEKKYNVRVEADLQQILQIGNTAFYTGKPSLRFMGLEEILQAGPLLHIDFIAKGLLPIFDCYENDFICYKVDGEGYCVLNIIDETEFFHSSSISDLLTKIGFK